MAFPISKSSWMILNDFNLMKFYECQHKGMTSMRRTSVYDVENEISGKIRVARIPSTYASGKILKYKIYKGIMMHLFNNLFKEKKINYAKMTSISMVVMEKLLESNKRLGNLFALQQDDHDDLKEEVFSNLEKIMNLFYDSDLDNSMKHCFTVDFQVHDYLEKILPIFNKFKIKYQMPPLDMENLKQSNFKVTYEILSLNKTGDNTATLVLVCPFDTHELTKSKNLWIKMLVNYINNYFNQDEFAKYFLDGWFAITTVITYNPLTMKRTIYDLKELVISLADSELIKMVSILQNKLSIKQLYSGLCDSCEARVSCMIAVNFGKTNGIRRRYEYKKQTIKKI